MLPTIRLPKRLDAIFRQTLKRLPVSTRKTLENVLWSEGWIIKTDDSLRFRGALACAWLGKKQILFCGDWHEQSDEELARIAAHELAHVLVDLWQPDLSRDEDLVDVLTRAWGFGPNDEHFLRRIKSRM